MLLFRRTALLLAAATFTAHIGFAQYGYPRLPRAPRPPRAAHNNTGEVKIENAPKGGSVYVDGALAGEADKLKQAGESGQIRPFTGGDYAKDLASGDAVAVIGWAADANSSSMKFSTLTGMVPFSTRCFRMA